MTEQELAKENLIRKLDRILDESVDDFYRKTHPIDTIRDEILKLITEAGYRLPAGKAPLLTDREIWQALDTPHPDDIVDAFKENCRNIAKAQNDADNKHYGGKE